MSKLRALHLRFIDPVRLLPHERHDPDHAAALADSMRDGGIWRVPLVAERASLVVMDGHHRLAAALALGLARVPVLLLAYREVPVEATRAGYAVTPEAIVARALAGDLYPVKTTRHAFDAPLPACHVSLHLLQPRQPAPAGITPSEVALPG
ncbi:hypothetical protein F3J11_28600 [Burkholderia sp. Cy-647]|uniref:ParB N-terminal domain-containing protein n=2 Tax=Burkholderia TaxID=32008 RepID=UPI00141F3434|nr:MULTISPECIES: ParB N-terminal domain-containing protein [unclassified Burkholderia]NIF66596.1 hypothetical protein [Burkholderia sp. Cy-647]NIF93326.1 hypothetical protein [Burkholderia sp. Cy-637]NIG00463.1 hypothetical protein [Burkholderia sp. Ax-1720]